MKWKKFHGMSDQQVEEMINDDSNYDPNAIIESMARVIARNPKEFGFNNVFVKRDFNQHQIQ